MPPFPLHDVVKLFVGDEAAAVQQLVWVDGLGQFLHIGIQQTVRIAKLAAFAAVRLTIVGLPTVRENDRLLLKLLRH